MAYAGGGDAPYGAGGGGMGGGGGSGGEGDDNEVVVKFRVDNKGFIEGVNQAGSAIATFGQSMATMARDAEAAMAGVEGSFKSLVLASRSNLAFSAVPWATRPFWLS